MRYNYRALASALVIAFAAGALAACGTSAQARFFTLSSSTAEPIAGSLAGSTIVVGPIELPEYLDRPQMALRGEQGEITFLEFQRWAEPLRAAFVRVFAEDLMIAAGTQQVVAVPIAQPMPADFNVVARVSRFDVDKAGQAKLAVQWFVSDTADKIIMPPRQTVYTRSAALPLTPEAGTAALSGTIADFAADVASSLAAIKK